MSFHFILSYTLCLECSWKLVLCSEVTLKEYKFLILTEFNTIQCNIQLNTKLNLQLQSEVQSKIEYRTKQN